MKIPFSVATESKQFAPLPESTYECRITDVTPGTSKNGNLQLALKLEILEGPEAARRVTCWYTITPKSAWRIQKLIDALGITLTGTGEVDPDGNEIKSFDHEELLQRCVTYDVKQREYNGRMNNDFNKPRVSPFDPVRAEVEAADRTAATPPKTMRRRPRS